jgi:hypothetical protein
MLCWNNNGLFPPLHRGAQHWQDADEVLSRVATAPSAMDNALVQMLRALGAEPMIWELRRLDESQRTIVSADCRMLHIGTLAFTHSGP